jgi:hypothetical protein
MVELHWTEIVSIIWALTILGVSIYSLLRKKDETKRRNKRTNQILILRKKPDTSRNGNNNTSNTTTNRRSKEKGGNRMKQQLVTYKVGAGMKRFKVVMLIDRTNKHHVEGVLEDIGAYMYSITEEEVRE